jgi:hypothetical protein
VNKSLEGLSRRLDWCWARADSLPGAIFNQGTGIALLEAVHISKTFFLGIGTFGYKPPATAGRERGVTLTLTQNPIAGTFA